MDSNGDGACFGGCEAGVNRSGDEDICMGDDTTTAASPVLEKIAAPTLDTTARPSSGAS